LHARQALNAFAPRLEVVGIDGRTRMFFVAALAMIGDLDGAYDLMNRFLREPAGAPLSVELGDLWLPEMRAFRADARFHELTQKLRLTDYWKRYGSPDP
jgi:hypothetical protein